jgi:SAM-dependent methyltransferase
VETPASERARRERAAYDEGLVYERNDAWHRRARHVLEGPNTRRGEQLWESLIRDAVGDGGRVLDVGCGDGSTARLALDCGATYVLGVEISERQLSGARETALPGRLEFEVADAQEPLDVGPFDLIIGRSVLHHLGFREFLTRVAEHNLSTDGCMLWMEPLAHPLALAFHKLVRSAHTPDEFPLLPRDLRWIRETFPGTQIFPINFVSFPAGVLSTFVFASADNRLLRAADVTDRFLARRDMLVPFGRQGIVSIPAGSHRSVRGTPV